MAGMAVVVLACAVAIGGNETDRGHAQKIKLTDERIVVSGVPWFKENKGTFLRLPLRLKDSFREKLWDQARCTSGARIRFRTNSLTVEVIGTVVPRIMYDMPMTGSCGLDIYVDGVYVGNAVPDAAGKIVNLRKVGPWIIGRTREMRDVTIYLPLYSEAKIDEIRLDQSARIEPPLPFAVPRPVVFYGSSITMGGCAGNPGVTYPAILSRWMNIDFVNLGFSGQGLGDESVAKAVTEIDAAAVVLDYWASPNVEEFVRTLPRFVGVLRAKWPALPIFVTGPYYEPITDYLGAGEAETTRKRAFALEFVKERRAAGDVNLSYIDGMDMISRDTAYGLIDGRHCNSIGFFFCAKGMEPHLRKALSLPASAAQRNAPPEAVPAAKP
jgi:hypothetical protein